MNYDTIISWVIAVTFAWLFVALNTKIQLTKQENRPISYTFSLWLCMITSFIGLVLSLYDNNLAIVFTPYVLITCAAVYTSVDFYYMKAKEAENAPGWLNLKSKVYNTLFQTMLIVVLVFGGLGFKKDLIHDTKSNKIETKIDSLDTKIEQNSLKASNDRAEIKKDLLVSEKEKKEALDKLNEKVDVQEAKKQTQLRKLEKDTKNIKKTQKVITDKIDDTKKTVERRKFLGIF